MLTRRIAWLIASKRARPEEILALTFTEKAAKEMEERVDLLVPYGYVETTIRTFHAFGDELLRAAAVPAGLSPTFRVLSKTEQLVFLRQHLFELPLERLRPAHDPARYVPALATVFNRAKDEAISPEEFVAYAAGAVPAGEAGPERAAELREVAQAYAAYNQLLRADQAVDFGDLVWLAIRLLERSPTVLNELRRRFRYIVVDEFQDTNYAQFRLLQLLAPPDSQVTVVADDDQCLPAGTMVATPQGHRAIERIGIGEEVLTAVGKGHVGTAKVSRVFRSEKASRMLTLRTKSGQRVRLTDNHKVFCYVPSIATRKDLHYVYLMHRRDVGWRLGVTNDLATRLRLERSADRIIGIRAFQSDSEARYHETLWSLTYGIPTVVFKSRQGIVIRGDLLKQLHLALGTDQRVQGLARDLKIDLDAHHACLDGVHRNGHTRVKVHLTMCDRRYRAKAASGVVLRRPSVLHTVRVQTSDPATISALHHAGLRVNQVTKGMAVRLSFADLEQAGAAAERLVELTQGFLETRLVAGRFHQLHLPALLMPAKNVLVGHYLPVLDRSTSQIVYDEVVEVSEERVTCVVFDLEVERTHNFIADGVVVHNSIYKWRGAALSNVLKFMEHYPQARTCVLTDNFRSPQALLDCAYRLIRFNDPDRLEVRQGVDKRLIARAHTGGQAPHLQLFDTVSSEADWVARTIRDAIDAGARRPQDFAILVRSNREADPFLRALNVAGIPWQFSGTSGLLAQEETKLLLSCLRALADPDHSLSWYHVASSPLYQLPMGDLAALSGRAARTNRTLREAFERLPSDPELAEGISAPAVQLAAQLLADLQRLLELSRTASAGQLLYRWLLDRGYLARLAALQESSDARSLQTVARFFEHLRELEELVGGRLPEVVRHLDLFEALGDAPSNEPDAFADHVSVLTLHKAKGLEFPVVFLVGLVQGRFPTPRRADPIELPDPLIKDLLPVGDHHLQEERRLFYVGMTRAREALYFTAAQRYGGKTVRKLSQFVCEALELASPAPPGRSASALERIAHSRPSAPMMPEAPREEGRLQRLDAHGMDDYLTCPLKYRYSHILRVPVMRHHVVAYGAALHGALEQYFKRRLAGAPMSEEELLGAFEAEWRSEGFLTRGHEEQRLAQGRATLQRFLVRQQAAPEQPWLIEERFKFGMDDLLISGRWDRVDREGEQAVIIDYKSSDVHEQAAADRRTRESFQLLVYALAWRTIHGQLPIRLELRFLESDLIGSTRFTEDDLERCRAQLREAASGIRARQFPARPEERTCRWCAFQAICPDAFQRV